MRPTTRAGRLHYELIRSLVETCSLPTRDELQARPGCAAVDEIDRAFEDLAALHGVVLHPTSHDVWAIHPLSLAPTLLLVESGDRRWWGNCAWCSLGSAVLVGAPCHITTTLGAENEQVRLTVENGRLNRRCLAETSSQSRRWTKKSMAEARAIFADLGLLHPVWSLPSEAGRS